MMFVGGGGGGGGGGIVGGAGDRGVGEVAGDNKSECCPGYSLLHYPLCPASPRYPAPHQTGRGIWKQDDYTLSNVSMSPFISFFSLINIVTILFFPFCSLLFSLPFKTISLTYSYFPLFNSFSSYLFSLFFSISLSINLSAYLFIYPILSFPIPSPVFPSSFLSCTIFPMSPSLLPFSPLPSPTLSRHTLTTSTKAHHPHSVAFLVRANRTLQTPPRLVLKPWVPRRIWRSGTKWKSSLLTSIFTSSPRLCKWFFFLLTYPIIFCLSHNVFYRFPSFVYVMCSIFFFSPILFIFIQLWTPKQQQKQQQ